MAFSSRLEGAGHTATVAWPERPPTGSYSIGANPSFVRLSANLYNRMRGRPDVKIEDSALEAVRGTGVKP